MEQHEVNDCRFATWCYIIIRRGCGCRCCLGAENLSLPCEKERTRDYMYIHIYLADKAREAVLVVDRYVRDCLKPSGQVAFHPRRAEM